MEPENYIYFSSREEWRSWLIDNHRKEKVIWLIFPKKSSERVRIPYNDAVEEALCFGWIDSIIRTLDSKNTIQRFTPRRKGSTYSQPNIERLRWLDKNDMLMPDVKGSVKDLLSEEFEYPEDIIREIKKDEDVWNIYLGFSDTYKRIRVAYIDSARDRPEEFNKRLKNFINRTKKEKQFGYGGIDKYF